MQDILETLPSHIVTIMARYGSDMNETNFSLQSSRTWYMCRCNLSSCLYYSRYNPCGCIKYLKFTQNNQNLNRDVGVYSSVKLFVVIVHCFDNSRENVCVYGINGHNGDGVRGKAYRAMNGIPDKYRHILLKFTGTNLC